MTGHFITNYSSAEKHPGFGRKFFLGANEWRVVDKNFEMT